MALFMCFVLDLKSQIIITVAGDGTQGFGGDGGPATSAQLNWPAGLCFDASGNLYIADELNYRVRQVDATGTINTVMGNGTMGYSGNGGQATAASLNFPIAIAYHAGDFYISDEGNSVIRKVNPSGVISTVVGTGTAGYSGDGGPADSAMLNYPVFVDFDNTGNMFIVDYNNHRIRMVDTSGSISTVAGNGSSGYSRDGGPADSAQLDHPTGIAFDAAGNFFIAGNSNNVVRKVDHLSGNISTIAGTGIAGYSGDGGPADSAQLHFPCHLAIDAASNILIVDGNNHCIRKIDVAGNISTIAGTGTAGYNGDGGPADSAQLNLPYGIAIDALGNVLIADLYNNRVRMIVYVDGIDGMNKDGVISVYPNPVKNSINVQLTRESEKIEIFNTQGQLVYKEEIENSSNKTSKKIELSHLPKALYMIKVSEVNSVKIGKVIKH